MAEEEKEGAAEGEKETGPIEASEEAPQEAEQEGEQEVELPSPAEVRKAHKDDLVRWCKAAGLETAGKVAVLRKRLMDYLEEKEEAEEAAAPTERWPGEVFVYSLRGRAKGTVKLPPVFSTDYRPDLIRRAVDAARANRRQPYGASPLSGMRHSVSWWGKGQGVARTPRIKGMRRGAQAPNTVGGRPNFPPKAERIWTKKINDKERLSARASALAAIAHADLVSSRGHRFPEDLSLPLVVEDKVEGIKSTRDAVRALEALGVYLDVQRALLGTKVRAGRGKMRGRRFKGRRSLLVVLSDSASSARAFTNLPGVEVTTPRGLNTELLAPGGHVGRLTMFSEKALKELEAW
jgi:large subunit ribosomal protein L4e